MIRRITSAVCKSAAAANEKFCCGLILAGREMTRLQSGFFNLFGPKAKNISSRPCFLIRPNPSSLNIRKMHARPAEGRKHTKDLNRDITDQQGTSTPVETQDSHRKVLTERGYILN